jgi:hypothetical protein
MKEIMQEWRKYLNEQVSQKRRLIYLIGPPAVGKSYWINQNFGDDNEGITYQKLSSDDIMEQFASESGIGTYDDMFKKPPHKIVPRPLPVPSSREDLENKNSAIRKEIEDYLLKLEVISSNYNKNNKEEVNRFGEVKPFSVDEYIKALLPYTEGGYGVPPNVFVPLYFPKVKEVGDKARESFSNKRRDISTPESRLPLIIDMVGTSKNERDGHRQEIALAYLGNSKGQKIDKSTVDEVMKNNFYQEAYVFSNDIQGWNDEEIKMIKKSVLIRSEEIKKMSNGKRSKTIPLGVVDGAVKRYNPPTPEEGFSQIQIVGIPAISRFNKI